MKHIFTILIFTFASSTFAAKTEYVQLSCNDSFSNPVLIEFIQQAGSVLIRLPSSTTVIVPAIEVAPVMQKQIAFMDGVTVVNDRVRLGFRVDGRGANGKVSLEIVAAAKNSRVPYSFCQIAEANAVVFP